MITVPAENGVLCGDGEENFLLFFTAFLNAKKYFILLIRFRAGTGPAGPETDRTGPVEKVNRAGRNRNFTG